MWSSEIKEALTQSGLPAHRLDIEITEGIFMSNARPVIDALQKLRNLGVGIALDDFGTGYSSLGYLGRLPVDKIKIDQSFVKRLPGDQQAGVIIRAVMMLSEALDKIVIAEGIETADQAWMLKMMGCKVGQGYHFGRPKSAAEMREMLSAKNPDADGAGSTIVLSRTCLTASRARAKPDAAEGIGFDEARASGKLARRRCMIAGIWVEPPVRISVSMRSAVRPARLTTMRSASSILSTPPAMAAVRSARVMRGGEFDLLAVEGEMRGVLVRSARSWRPRRRRPGDGLRGG